MKTFKKIICVLLCIVLIGSAFAGCSSPVLKDLQSGQTYTAVNKDYENDAKKNQTKFKYVVENNEVVVTKYTDSTERLVVEVPDEIDGMPVTKIADFSLFNAESLETIKIGKNVKEIGPWSMTNNYHLKEFVVDEANPYFCSVDGVLFSKDMKTIIYFPPGKGINGYDGYGTATNFTTYAIPDGVEVVGTKCFYKCYYIEDITIPSSVKRIEEKAFHRVSKLNKLELPEGLEFIGKDAFAYCFSENYKDDKHPELPETTEIVIPSTVKEIGDYAFFQCEKVSKVTMLPVEKDVKLGKVWSPSTKGKENKNCEIVWQNN